MPIKSLLHVELGVEDLDASVEFHRDALGLEETAREDGTAYMAAPGRSGDAYLVALTEGGTGVRHFALGVASEDDLAGFKQNLEGLGVALETVNGGEPGQESAVRFSAPSGHVIELVLSEDSGHDPLSGSLGARGLDHITLRAPDVKGLADFLGAALGNKVSDAFTPAPDVWGAAWTRFDDLHHDIAIIGGPPDSGDTLDHLAWRMDSFDDLKTAGDSLSGMEIPLEAGPGRHRLGGNLFAYFWSPGGNRYELSSEMPKVDNDEPGLWTDFMNAFSAWGQVPPESFGRGS